MTNRAGKIQLFDTFAVRCALLVRRPTMKKLAIVLAVILLAPALAYAQCVQPPEEGTWINTEANTRSIPRIQLRFVCQDQILNGQPYPPGPPWYVHVWGACSPTNCDWGEVGAQRLSSGHIFATYDQGFA